jgi:hypothetical protein
LNPAQNYFHDLIHPDRHPACRRHHQKTAFERAEHIAFRWKIAFVRAHTACHLQMAFVPEQIAFRLKAAFVQAHIAFHLKMAVVQGLTPCNHVLASEYAKSYLSLVFLPHRVWRSPAFHDQRYSAW